MKATSPFLLPTLLVMLVCDVLGFSIPGWTWAAVIVSSIIVERR